MRLAGVMDKDFDPFEVHFQLGRKLQSASALWRGQSPDDKLDALAVVLVALNEYARSTNAPSDVLWLLTDSLGELGNLRDGRGSEVFGAPYVPGSKKRRLQSEMLWAAASVFIDNQPRKEAARIEAERIIHAANLPLPGSSTKPGARLRKFQTDNSAVKRDDEMNKHFEAVADIVAALMDEGGLSRAEAARKMFMSFVKPRRK